MKHLNRKNNAWLLVLALLLAACSSWPGLKAQPAAATAPGPAIQTESGQPIKTGAALPTSTGQAAESAAPKSAAAGEGSQPVFTTTMGAFAIQAVRWVDKVNGVTPGPGERLLLIFLSKPGEPRLAPSNFSLQVFNDAMRKQTNGEVHIAFDDGSRAVCSMAGWVEPDYQSFAMGFRIPEAVKTLQFVWPGNDPIDLFPEG